ncbi:pilus assembly protein FimV, partial [Paraburkholderia sp. Tr-20389]|uniref:FimV/HubP family polar landmark protein n=1 Tax=Paraburkholderia sp. Tr-20389 TaxID=2703903 RepID=UPI001981D721
YTGSVQGSEPAATSPGAPAANAQPASQARPSSLQQLLALKNRVLMELQKHGIGKQPGTNENPAAGTGATQPSNAAPGASAPAHAAPSAAPSASPATGIPQEYLGAAAIAGAALVALLAGLTMRRRRKARRAQEAASAEMAHEDETPSVAPVATEPRAFAPRDEVPSTEKEESEAPSHDGSAAAGAAAAYEATASSHATEHEAESRAEPETFHAASAEAALDAAATLGADALPRESLDPAREEARAAEAAELEQTAREQELTPDETAADTPVADLSLDETPIHEPVEPHFAEPIEAPHDESEAKPTPFMLNLGPAHGSAQIEPTFEQPIASAAPPIQLSHVEPAAQHEQLIEPLPEAVDEARADFEEDEAEQNIPASLPLGAPPPLEPAVPHEFPREAMRALDSIDDFALPPRTESHASAESAVTSPGSLATQPVVAPEITAQQAVPSHLPQSPAVADQIIAGTAGAAAVAGLGASRFGALKLDFDLELPPSPAQVVPSFSPDEIARIARNKLDLAAEYIDLGDVVGARTLINEVIESNDADTRADARALLSTLAPLS